MTYDLGRACRGLVLVVATALVAAAPAVADTTYPRNFVHPTAGSTFDTGTDGWTDAEHSCGLLDPRLPLLCSTNNEHSGGTGNPPGSIRSSYQTIFNALGLASGTATWRSPQFQLFEATPGRIAAGTGGIFSMDLKAEIRALLDVGGAATIAVTLIDVDNGKEVDLYENEAFACDEEATPDPCESFINAGGITVGPSDLIAGHRYRIEISTTFKSVPLQVLNGTISVFYDNVKLTVDDGTSTGDAPEVITLAPTDVTDTRATLNSAINPRGVPAFFGYEYGKTPAYDSNTFHEFGVILGERLVQPNAHIVGDDEPALEKCTTYNNRVIVRREGQPTAYPGQNVVFQTWCQPTVTTLPVTAISANTAQFNGSINPNGPETFYHYEYGPTSSGALNWAPAANRSAGGGRETKMPLGEPIASLAPQTQYRVRIVAENRLGVSTGDFVTFTTPAPSGPGAPGAPGAPGTTGASGPTDQVLFNGDRRAFLRIRSALVKVGTAGRRRGQVRLAIFCSQRTGRSCAGTIKIRSRGRLNPSTIGRRVARRRVTFLTFEYQLAAGRRGWAIAQMPIEKLNLMERIKRVGVNISVQVTDVEGNRQTIIRSGRLVTRRSP